jgi:hypothetical protein
MAQGPQEPADARSEREKRLAEALRANLKRRKQRQRRDAAAAAADNPGKQG